MTVNGWLWWAQQQLIADGIETARLDCLVLLEDCLNKNRTHLLAHPEIEITAEQQKYLWNCVQRRAKHEPLAYIRGKVEFYGREFIIDKHVLVPRPESETIIDLLKVASLSNHPHIADVGTGSGALGIIAKLELPDARVDLFELDQATMHVAKKNISKFSVSVQCFESDLLTSADIFYDVVIANLPYVPDSFQINRAAQAEPRLAIFGGPDGLTLHRQLFAQIQSFDWKPLVILTESLPSQHAELEKIANKANFRLVKTDDFIQQFANTA